MEYITDLDQCHSMTGLALAHGRLAGELYLRTSAAPTPLFQLNYICRDDTKIDMATNAFMELIRAGYDQETQKHSGNTPLFDGVFSPRGLSFTVMELWLVENANIHATDNSGRGALHICLSFSESLQQHFLEVCRRLSLVHNFLYDVDSPTSEEASEPENMSRADSNVQEIRPCDKYNDSVSEDGIGDEESVIDECNELSKSSAMSFSGYDIEDSLADTPSSQECYWCNRTPGYDCEGMDDGELAIFNYCEERDIDDFKISETPDPESEVRMCKAKIRLKLLMLLKADDARTFWTTKGFLQAITQNGKDYGHNGSGLSSTVAFNMIGILIHGFGNLEGSLAALLFSLPFCIWVIGLRSIRSIGDP